MALVDTSDLISISDAAKLGPSGRIRAAQEGHGHVLPCNNKPVAAVVSMDRLEQFQQLAADMADVPLAVARTLTTDPGRHSLDDVLAQFGYTRDQLRAMEWATCLSVSS